jgi:hypothetical protein
VLATRIKNARTEREAKIARFLGERMGISGQALEQAKTAMSRAELLLLQRFAGVYKNRDEGAAAQFDMDLEAALAPYYELEGGGIVVAPEPPDEDVSALETLRVENQRLSDELRVTMETMSRMLNEYSTMFSGGSLGQPAQIAALVGGAMADKSRPEGETLLDPVPGEAAPPFEPDTPVEMAAEADVAVDLEADTDTGVVPAITPEVGGEDTDDADTPAQDDIDALLAAESDAPLPDGLGDAEAMSGTTGALNQRIATDGSIDQPADAQAINEFEVETGIGVGVGVAAPTVDTGAGDDLDAAAEILEEGPAEVISIDESDGFEVELAMHEGDLFDSAESQGVVRTEGAAVDPLDDAGAEGALDMDALFDAVDEPVEQRSGH